MSPQDEGLPPKGPLFVGLVDGKILVDDPREGPRSLTSDQARCLAAQLRGRHAGNERAAAHLERLALLADRPGGQA